MKTLLSLFILGISINSYAWRETGHFTACEVAYRQLTPEAKLAVDQIAGEENFSEQCTWPDMVRKSPEWKHSYPWHFINIEDGQEYFEKESFSLRGDVMQAILSSTEALKSSVLKTEEKLIQLRFLGHFVGDIHQPLHIGRKTDLGGNNHKVEWHGHEHYLYKEILRANEGEECRVHEPTGECVYTRARSSAYNLHKVWDLHMIEKFIEKTFSELEPGDSIRFPYRTYATHIENVSDKLVRKWQNSTVLDWAQESLCYRSRGYDFEGKKLGKAYYDRNIGLVNKRLVKAGYRLAGILNQVFDSDYKKPSKALIKREKQLKRAISRMHSGRVVRNHSLSTLFCD